jgi:hypothetical protein
MTRLAARDDDTTTDSTGARAARAHRSTGGAAPLSGLVPVATLHRRWPAMAGALVSAAMLGGLAHELLDNGLVGLTRAVPTSPWFYVFFVASYLTAPVFDFLIFRRLWGVPASAFLALNKKRIANDVVIGYSGDAYFYLWARERLRMVAAPFGAVKDVTIVSGIAGNLSTILLGAIALPLGWELIDPEVRRMMLWSISVPVIVSVLVLAFSSRVFSLQRLQLWFVFVTYVVRILVGAAMIALAWAYAIPNVSLGMWMFLIAGRQLVTRLPLVPNKDLLFANFAILVIGQDKALADLMAFSAASTLVLHLLLTVAFGAAYVFERFVEWRREC